MHRNSAVGNGREFAIAHSRFHPPPGASRFAQSVELAFRYQPSAFSYDSPENLLSGKRTLRYSLLAGRYAICKLPPDSPLPEWALRQDEFSSITRTSDEVSIVCPEDWVPADVHAARDWVCLKLQGPFAFSETGILSAFLHPLAEHEIGIFAISTFDTDYLLIEEKGWKKASEALSAAGHEVVVRSQ